VRSVGILDGLKSVIAFLTVIPIKNGHSLEDMGRYMPLFPLVGSIIGLISGIFAWSLLHILPGIIVGILTLGFILLVTGIHHTDGLLDFGDGIMYQGPPKKKVEVMHDKQTGAGGLTFGLVFLMATAFSIGLLSISEIIQSLIVAEISAKLAMVMIAWAGKSAHEGLGTYCVDAMHGNLRLQKLMIPLIISFVIAIPLMRIVGLVVVISAVVVSLIIVWSSNRHFNGITGDVFGAVNEIIRATSLIVILVLVQWL